MVIDPQPAQSYGVVAAVPDWADTETIICFDTSEVDGRLFVIVSLTSVDHIALIRFAGLSQHQHFDIYIGTNHVPLQVGE